MLDKLRELAQKYDLRSEELTDPAVYGNPDKLRALNQELRELEPLAEAYHQYEEASAALIGKFKSLIEANGTIDSVDDWGKRRLAYPINDLTEGHYVLMTFTAAPELPAELDRVLKITEGIMRSMIVCKDE